VNRRERAEWGRACIRYLRKRYPGVVFSLEARDDCGDVVPAFLGPHGIADQSCSAAVWGHRFGWRVWRSYRPGQSARNTVAVDLDEATAAHFCGTGRIE
jgi:hypothetical protein